MEEYQIQVIELIASLILIPLFVYFLNYYIIGIKLDENYSFTKSINLNHSLINNDLNWSYGQAQFNINLINKSKYNKTLKVKHLRMEAKNFKLIDFENIIFDYCIKFNNGSFMGYEETISHLYLYMINNGTGQNKNNNLMITLLGDNEIIFNSEKSFKLTEGEIQEVFKLNLNDINILTKFKDFNFSFLKIKINYKDIDEEINIKYSNGKFIYSSPQLGGGSGINTGNIIDLVINKDEKNYNYEPLKIKGHNSEKIKIKLFSEKSSSFNFQITYKGTVIKEKVVLKVPIYNIPIYNSRLLPFNSFSKFMIENNYNNFKLSEDLINTSSLYLYDINHYLEKQK